MCMASPSPDVPGMLLMPSDMVPSDSKSGLLSPPRVFSPSQRARQLIVVPVETRISQ